MRHGPIASFAESVTVADLEADPYPIYARLRRDAPVCFIPAVRLWFVTRYEDVEYVGTHPDQFTAELDDSPVDHTFGSPTILTWSCAAAWIPSTAPSTSSVTSTTWSGRSRSRYSMGSQAAITPN
jgi:cytochrome P450